MMEPQSFDDNNFPISMNSRFERYDSLSRTEACPSLTSSFLTIETSSMSCNEDENEYREPISPEIFTMSSQASVTSPLTPIGPADLDETHNMVVWPKNQPNNIWHNPDVSPGNLWLASEEAAMAQCVMNNFAQQDLSMFPPGYIDFVERPKPNSDPPLSRAVFANATSQHEDHIAVNETLSWSQALDRAYPPTIAPNVTFQNVMPSSPPSDLEQMTPMKHHRCDSSMFASSPLTNQSSSVLTSHWDADETRYIPVSDTHSYYGQESNPYLSSYSQDQQVSSSDSSPPRTGTSKSGVDCEAVIPQNVFACSVPGCVDKDGKPKRFRRQEHKKRHEKTVHKKDASFPCWVQTGGKPCGKVFTRRDNLNSHLKKTHGSRKNNQRNSYVATLDESSKYFDEKWRGQLTADGLPVGHPRWPEVC